MIAYQDSGLARKLPLRPGIALEAHAAPSAARLNVVLPNFFKNYAFGGITSAMELAREISRHYAHVRFVSLAPLGRVEEMFDFASFVSGRTQTLSAASVSPTTSGDQPLPCHGAEVFFCTYWATVLLWEAYDQALRAEQRSAPDFYYFIQDYEPGFYPFGTNHSLSLASYGHGERTHALFNAAELAAFFGKRGFSFARSYTLLPSLNPAMEARLKARDYMLPAKPTQRTTIVLYGRPQTPRNCFEAAVDGLYRFVTALEPEQQKRLEIVSAGREHDDIELAPGVVVQSVGKLHLEDYIALLERAHLGISLMASPHPSYPPLEMAVFGLRVLSNVYECKDLSRQHLGIRSLSAPDAVEVAEALAEELPPLLHSAGAQRAKLPGNMSPLPWRENVRRLGVARIDASG